MIQQNLNLYFILLTINLHFLIFIIMAMRINNSLLNAYIEVVNEYFKNIIFVPLFLLKK